MVWLAIVKDGTYDKIINKYLDNNKSKERAQPKLLMKQQLLA